MAKLKFTDASVRALPAPAAANRMDYALNDVRGFAMQTTYVGAKQFLLAYLARDSGRERRLVLGEFGPAPKLSVSRPKFISLPSRSTRMPTARCNELKTTLTSMRCVDCSSCC